MPTLSDIVCGVAQQEAVRATVGESCNETGDRLIERSVYEDPNKVLLIVQLLHTTSVSQQVPAFSQALHQELIASCECMTAQLVTISFLRGTYERRGVIALYVLASRGFLLLTMRIRPRQRP